MKKFLLIFIIITLLNVLTTWFYYDPGGRCGTLKPMYQKNSQTYLLIDKAFSQDYNDWGMTEVCHLDVGYFAIGYPAFVIVQSNAGFTANEWFFYPNYLIINIIWEIILAAVLTMLLGRKKHKVKTQSAGIHNN